MRIRIGHEMTIEVAQPTPLISLTTPEPARHRDYAFPEDFRTVPHVPVQNYVDRFGNICRRMVAPAGTFTLFSDITINDAGTRDEADFNAVEWPVEALPSEVLGYLTASRYVEVDLVSDEAWTLFGHVAPGWNRVQHIVDHVNGSMVFDYKLASQFRTAASARNDGVAVCRDFAHLTLAYLRALNIPARYVNGYVGDIGVPAAAAPMDFAAWIEVFLGGKWWTFDPRNNQRRIGRVVVARGMDAADVPLINTFGPHTLTGFRVWCHAVDEAGNELDGMLFA
ncbi:transglutaminase family protein [Paracoccus sp. WLY502]|uniref:transglutaminase-like domain-containing protein n=1 Tax=Paracoccus yibinensis TaxID=3068891 RepID=UPI002796A8DA|nr:transglutaminase family protein [Paracoccus sp. WLY502]MDQ1899054.1 transglutaminase family protein [Paracoccus sp. WLY502]